MNQFVSMEVLLLANVKEIAKLAKVSVGTVSKVINNDPTVKPKNREKVLKAIKKFNYVPNIHARNLSTGKTKMISIVSPTLGDEFHERLASSIDKILSENNYDSVFFPLLSQERLKRFSNPSHFLYQTDGLIVSSLSLTRMFDNKTLPTYKPNILVDTRDELNNCLYVDNFLGGQLAARNIKIFENSNIYVLGGYEPDKVFSSGVFTERLNGFVYELVNKKGIKKGKIVIREVGLSWKEGYEFGKYFAKHKRQKFSVFALSDVIAYGFIEGAKSQGLYPPKDYFILGYDDLSYSEAIGLSTIRQPIEELGKLAAEILLNKINGYLDNKVNKSLKPEFIKRETN
jgi:LacI family transcriptional regulator